MVYYSLPFVNPWVPSLSMRIPNLRRSCVRSNAVRESTQRSSGGGNLRLIALPKHLNLFFLSSTSAARAA